MGRGKGKKQVVLLRDFCLLPRICQQIEAELWLPTFTSASLPDEAVELHFRKACMRVSASLNPVTNCPDLAPSSNMYMLRGALVGRMRASGARRVGLAALG